MDLLRVYGRKEKIEGNDEKYEEVKKLEQLVNQKTAEPASCAIALLR